MKEYEYEFAEFLYYTPGDLDRQARMWPVRAGRSLAKPNYRVGPKRIECYSFHFIHAGKLRLKYGGKAVTLQSGDLFCLFPDRTYYYEMAPAELTLRMSWLALDGERVPPLLKLIGLSPDKPYLEKAVTPQVKKTAEQTIQLLSGLERWNPAAALELQGLINRLFAGFLAGCSRPRFAESAGWLKECLAYMELHATEGITVQQVADYAGLHRSYFSQAFTQHFGISPAKYLQKIRMDKAIRLLEDTDASVTEIAFTLGYSNLGSFTRAFKMYCDIPPQAVRASRQGEQGS
jgi:AraC-like DNA-binding protein